ncbi:MAG: phosphatidylserine/phosphatidylglycerophosphate/cardiolipin synthase family protein, partial [Parcubacteria group bacterium]|nr:phosphatidylserine/phosphatidylglycerophosphate/cardiolipin synthase family protein [Parcubacteria group bacterium]
MRYQFYTNSKKTWQAMFDAMQTARESVYLETYIFLDDLHNFNFLHLLKKKAREGVRVRVVLDAWGSLSLSREAVAELRAAGAEVFFYSHFLHRVHRKILILDETTAFIGGVNFHQIASRWNDLTLKIRGKLVLSILRSFAKVYAECGGRDARILLHHKKIILDKTRNWLVEHFPEHRSATLKRIYRQAFRRAEKNIILVTPYLIPRRWLLRALHQAVLRGVRVEVLMPKVSNHPMGNTVGYFFMHKLALLGVRFFLQPGMNHAKGMLIDGREGLIGSNNLDFFSFDLNSEVGVFL